jgi:hypothetical protein
MRVYDGGLPGREPDPGKVPLLPAGPCRRPVWAADR